MVALTLISAQSIANADYLEARSRGFGYKKPQVWASYGFQPDNPRRLDFGFIIPVIGRFLSPAVEAEIENYMSGETSLSVEAAYEATNALKKRRIRVQVFSRGRILGNCTPPLLWFSRDNPTNNNPDPSGILRFGSDVSWIGYNDGKPSQKDRGRCVRIGTRQRFAPSPLLGDEIRLVFGPRGQILAKALFVRKGE